ncbi:MAG: APC family permease [Thaumarchaeota archaeon]|jgi:APA family basic amino acid/polyamine antiporter|nr:APC family permease [Candidatus Geocrenenecus arthurdayi]MCL7402785.1 APC family permease [Candidatus Geocrenenecus arthurdayi]
MSEEVSLKREVGWFGSFSLGYADVGADIFIALGLIALYAAGATPIVFLVTAFIYISIGLVYAELAPTYPYAGGVQVYAMKGFNDLVGFTAGWALILDYTIDISLFALAAAGYFSYLLPQFASLLALMGLPPLGVISVIFIGTLILINYLGIKYSVEVSMGLVILGLIIQGFVLIPGFLLVFDFSKLLEQLQILGSPKIQSEVAYVASVPINIQNLLYSLTLAMASFVGIESIAQAAEETRHPARHIPKAAKLSIIAVLISVMGFSILSIGSVGWEKISGELEYSIAGLVRTYPIIGGFGAKLVALAGFILCYASSNTGVVGVSRLVASMGRYKLLPRWFYKIHPRFKTPTRTIVLFGLIGLLLASFGNIPFVAELYIFGALVSYLILMLAFIKLRNLREEVYRPWIVPGEVSLKIGGGTFKIPIVGVIGFIGVASLLILTLLFHAKGRVLGLLWLTTGVVMYMVYRRRIGLKAASSTSAQQILPISHIYDVGILVRPVIERAEAIIDTVSRSLDKRFRITLISVVDPEEFNLNLSDITDRAQLYQLRSEALSELEEVAEKLRKIGYKAEAMVFIGDLEKIISILIDSGRLEFIALIRRITEKIKIEKTHEDKLYRVISKYHGKIMVLRRI